MEPFWVMKKYPGSGLISNKISSQLSLFNTWNSTSREHSCNISEEFNFKDTEELLDKEDQPWFKIGNVGRFLGIENIQTLLNGLENHEMLTRQDSEPTQYYTPDWSGSKKQQNKQSR